MDHFIRIGCEMLSEMLCLMVNSLFCNIIEDSKIMLFYYPNYGYTKNDYEQ